uniref:Phosphatidylinositol-glycan biosynthesis class W protein n=1 Tax=Phaeomonas parva TaxID=124430 RepID=A0A7S1TV93_9STRA|mmetsp:Transcript_19476/g.58863  ORF Transcript_19476/g.58863 Transcript_19476/m.58863 type:complete len:526 (+) Transcript_19476:229-1806(+)
MAALDDAYREAKEAFVANTGGGDAFEVALLLLSYPVVSFLAVQILTLLNQNCPGLRMRLVRHGVVLEALVLLPWTLLCNFRPGAAPLALGGVAALAVPLWAANAAHQEVAGLNKVEFRAYWLLIAPRRPAIDRLRAFMVLGTCATILAVDFPAMPRRLAKTDFYGVSLMDVGVGAFAFAGGLCSGDARSVSHPKVYGEDRRRPSRWAIRSGAILILGLGRYAVTTALNYQTPDTEYGVHWNFFLSMGVVEVLCCLMRAYARCTRQSVVSCMGLTGALLSLQAFAILRLSPGRFFDDEKWGGRFDNLEGFIFHAPREGGFIMANREGVWGCVGLFSLYCFGVVTGAYAAQSLDLQKMAARKSRSQYAILFLALRMLGLIGATAAALGVSRFGLGERISRRLMTLSYVLWVTLLMQALLLACMVPDMVMTPDIWKSHLERCLSKYQLPVFLLANVLTGLVNMCMDTMAAGPAASVPITAAYLVALCLAALWMDGKPSGNVPSTADADSKQSFEKTIRQRRQQDQKQD